jgi:hypothetical protein
MCFFHIAKKTPIAHPNRGQRDLYVQDRIVDDYLPHANITYILKVELKKLYQQ